MANLPIILTIAFIVSFAIAFIEHGVRIDAAKTATSAAQRRSAHFAARSARIATLERFAASADRCGHTIDARNFRARAARLATWQSEDEATPF